MAGDVNNAAVWAEADVLVGALTATNPADGAAFGVDWSYAGLLDGDDGFGLSRDMDSSDFYAWGGILVATTRRNFKLTRTFTALEDNQVVWDLIWPGSDVTFTGNTYTGSIKVPDLQAKFKMAWETRSGDTLKRVISANYCQVEEVGEATESESDLQSYPVTVTVYPASDGTLFDVFKGAAA